uniref:Sortilin related VPS10 domain containing receptor 2 n=1 Tax=Vombatus ursinus TaxID=29139 RepID=A0A4X2M4E9_VOMUR
QLITFFVETLIFHPKEEDKVVAYTKESKVKFNDPTCLLYKNRFWSLFSPGFRYVTCQSQNCSDRTPTIPFASSIDHNSLTVQDDYIFFKATTANRTKYYVSYRRNEFVLMKLPKYALPKDLQIISTDENEVFVAVQEWYQTDTYNLYQSDPQGVYYSIVLENVRSTKQPEENVLIDILEVRGVKGVFLANQKIDGKVTTLITYNKGRDWDYLTPPAIDMNGKPTNCKPPDCHLHLHLRWADNPYVSGTVHTKDTAPGLIMGAGNLGSQLVEYKEEMYITSDCGNTWRQVFEEEHHILYLDHGFSPLHIDEGHTWSTHNFTSTSVFVDGLLSEPGDETLVMTVFGHISFRSDWELVKVDFRPSFPRQCTEDDYDYWNLTNLQGNHCIMGQQRSFRKRKTTSWCIKGQSFTSVLTSSVCKCSSSDFFCHSSLCKNLSLICCRYRKVVSNVCEGGVDLQRYVFQHQCPLTAPRGLRVSIKGETVAVKPGEDVTFVVRQEQGDVVNTKYLVDLGDGFKAVYVNLTVTGEPIRHRYENPGIYRVFVKAENAAGHEETVLFVQVNSPLRALHLEVVPVIGVNQEVNLTAILLPQNPNLTVFYWWIGNNLQPLLSLDNFLVTQFSETGEVRVTVQASCGNSMLQDSKVIRVLDQFQVLPLKFTKHLDMYNPNIPEWREDIGLVVTRLLSEETNIPEETLLTVVKPGLPTTADLHVLLPSPKPKRKRSVPSDKIHFQIFFLLYLRKLPGRTVYAQMHNEKEQEMTSPVNHSEDTQNIIQGEEFIDDDVDSQTLGNTRGNFTFLYSPFAEYKIIFSL